MITARIIWKTCTPLHCGGGIDSMQDQPVTRDAFGFWRIPGSSVAGILRSYARKTLGEQLENTLFGQQEGGTTPSLVWCSDADLLDYDGMRAADKIMHNQPVQIQTQAVVRDHVKLDLTTDTNTEGGKFDEEIVPPGACFSLEITLDGWNRQLTAEEEHAFLLLVSAMQGELRFGGKQTNGYGRVKAMYAECRSFDMTKPEDVTDWLNLAAGPKFAQEGGHPVDLAKLDTLQSQALPDKGINCDITIPFKTMGPLLIGGSNDRDEADMTFLLTPVLGDSPADEHLCYTIPGSAIRGALRHRVWKIAGFLGMDADDMINDIFGFIKTGKEEDQGKSGKLMIEDVFLPHKLAAKGIQHVAIDRFTGGTVQGALFNEAPVWENGLEFEIRLFANDLTDHEAKIVLHALLDLACGELPLGGGVNRGNGRVCIRNLDAGLGKALTGVRGDVSRNGEALDFQDRAMLERWLKELEG